MLLNVPARCNSTVGQLLPTTILFSAGEGSLCSTSPTPCTSSPGWPSSSSTTTTCSRSSSWPSAPRSTRSASGWRTQSVSCRFAPQSGRPSLPRSVESRPLHPVAEYTNEEGRLYLYAAGWIFWVFGICFLSLVAWASGHWMTYGLATTLPNFILFIFWW